MRRTFRLSTALDQATVINVQSDKPSSSVKLGVSVLLQGVPIVIAGWMPDTGREALIAWLKSKNPTAKITYDGEEV